MKLIYRGNAYEVSAPSQFGSNSTDQPKIKLIYRGHTFDYASRPVVVSEEIATKRSTVTLVYRGNTYERELQASKPYAINWRWQ